MHIMIELARAGSVREISKNGDRPRWKTENFMMSKMKIFNPQRTLSGSFLVIPERLASIRAVVLAFTVNKQTKTNTR